VSDLLEKRFTITFNHITSDAIRPVVWGRWFGDDGLIHDVLQTRETAESVYYMRCRSRDAADAVLHPRLVEDEAMCLSCIAFQEPRICYINAKAVAKLEMTWEEPDDA